MISTKVINKDPRNTIPDIRERDIDNKVILLDIKEPIGFNWIYIAKKEGNDISWYGCNIRSSGPHNWFIGPHLISIITYIYDECPDFIKTVYILESLQEVEELLIKLNSNNKINDGLRSTIIQHSNEIFHGGISSEDN